MNQLTEFNMISASLLGLMGGDFAGVIDGQTRVNALKKQATAKKATPVVEYRQLNRHAPAGGRNASCTCGSGLKYKKCHGKAPSYEVDSDGNTRIVKQATQTSQIKELNFYNLAGLDDQKVADVFGTVPAAAGAESEPVEVPVGSVPEGA